MNSLIDNISIYIIICNIYYIIISEKIYKIIENLSFTIIRSNKIKELRNNIKEKNNKIEEFKKIILNNIYLINKLRTKLIKEKDLSDSYINKIKERNNNNIKELKYIINLNVNKIIEFRKKIIDKIEKLEENKFNKCSICFENNISRCCNPCGHTFCEVCIKNTNNCYICRSDITSKITIYI